MESEATSQATGQAQAGSETVDADTLRNQLREEVLRELKPPYEAALAGWRKKYGDESNAWGAKFTAQAEELDQLKAVAEAAKLSPEATDWVARRRNSDRTMAEARDAKAQAQKMMDEARAVTVLAGIRVQPWAAKVPEEWFVKAKERLLNNEVSASIELAWEAQALAGKAGASETKGTGAGLSGLGAGGGGQRPTLAALVKEDISHYGPKEMADYQKRWDAAQK